MPSYQHIHTCPHCGFEDPQNRGLGAKKTIKCSFCSEKFTANGNYYEPKYKKVTECLECGSKNITIF